MIHDIAIIGAGMAGASVAAALDGARVLLLEREDAPGYHATGRSAAFWDQCYGGPGVAPLTSASGAYLHDGGFLQPRGSLYLARAGEEDRLASFAAPFRAQGVRLDLLDRTALLARVPGIHAAWSAAIAGPECSDIDVAALHAHYLDQARRAGTQLVCRADVRALARRGDVWTIDTHAGAFQARTLVNAAGAWADPIAELAGVRPLGLTPYRRTIAQLRVSPAVSETLPLVIDLDGNFYFKPSAGGRLWLSPHDETPSPPCDAAPDALDVAIAIARLADVTDWQVEAVEHRWAGLRTFAPDRLPIFGFDPRMPHFFWCAGQGGFGIQTAPAAAQLCAALLKAQPPTLIDPAAFDPARFG